MVSGVKTVTGIAVDWISKNLYWIDSGKVCCFLVELRNDDVEATRPTTITTNVDI